MPSEAARNDRPCVLMVAPQPCFDVRGTPMNILCMCRSLTDLGYEVHLATYPMGAHEDVPHVVYHRSMGVPFIRSVPIGFSFAKIVLDVFLAMTTLRLVARKRVRVVHAVEEAAFFCVPLAKLFNKPVIVDMDSDVADQLGNHSSALVRFLSKLVVPVMRWTLRRSACALTVCRALTDTVERDAPSTRVFQIEDIPLPSAHRTPDAAATASLAEELGVSGKRVVLYTGNLESYQGVDLLLDAWPAVMRSVPNAVVVLAGGEPHQVSAYRQRARLLEVDKSFLAIGKRPADEMPELMSLADVLVSPRSEGENTPLKIFSYMLSGRPIVATNLRTHTQVLDEGSAVLVAPSAEAFAKGLIEILGDRERGAELAKRAKAKVERDHSYDVFKRKLGEVYAFVLRAD